MDKKLLNRLFFVLEKEPYLRIGQFINVVCKDKDLFYIEDNELIELMEKFIGEVTTLGLMKREYISKEEAINKIKVMCEKY